MTRETNNIVIYEEGVILMCAPKAANTSIKQALHDAGYAAAGAKNRYFGFTHWTAVECALSEYRRVAILRHPGDRLVSTWSAKLQDKLGEREKVDMIERHAGLIHRGISWTVFVDAVLRIPDKRADPHLRSQCFDRFHKGLYLPTTVFKIEAPIDSWWPKLRKFLPKLPSRMPRENVSGQRPTIDQLCSQRDRDSINTRYFADFMLGGYPLL